MSKSWKEQTNLYIYKCSIKKILEEFDWFGNFGKKKPYLLFGPVFVPMLVIWDPFKHPLRHLRQFFLLDSVHFSRNSSSWGFFFLFFFFWFWKQINCFEIMCFWKFWETLELLLILSTRSTLSALVFQRTASKSRFFFFFWIDFSFEALYLDFFDTLLNFLDTHYLI